MLRLLSDLQVDDRFDYCIIGTGPAGITCAIALSSARKRVLLLEGGDFQWSAQSQDLYRGNNVGDKYHPLEVGRLRFFGGTSNHWTGWCRPLDPEDFRPKGKIRSVTWPISKAELDPYLPEASRILRVPKVPGDKPIPGSNLKRMRIAVSKPVVRFGADYRKRILEDPNILLTLNSNLVSFDTNGRAIQAANIAGFDGVRRKVRADRYVLAAGGIENSRLLLWSNVVSKGAVVKHPAALGRYWMEHPHFNIGEALVSDGELPADLEFVSPMPAFMERESVMNCRLGVERMPYKEQSKKLIADIACVAPDLAGALFEKLGKRLICGANVRAAWEQEPRRQSRIELSSDRDALGLPRVNLHWSKGINDLRTVRGVSEEFGAWLAREDIGRLRIRPWVLGEEAYPEGDELGGFHHMGGTRMALKPDDGVVDVNCRVFGQDNLYIAGSSVFPAGGHTNPTLTIVQLALRLASHLRSLG